MSIRDITIAGYLAIVLLAVAIDLAARAGARIPSFGEVVTLLSRSRVLRLALIALWWWIGWHFLARSGPGPL